MTTPERAVPDEIKDALLNPYAQLGRGSGPGPLGNQVVASSKAGAVFRA